MRNCPVKQEPRLDSDKQSEQELDYLLLRIDLTDGDEIPEYKMT